MKALGRRFELATTEFDFSRHLSTALRPMSLLAGLTAAGVAAVYLMGLTGILPETSGQLLLGALVLGLLALLHRPIVRLAQDGHGTRAYWLHAVFTALTGVLLAALWDGAAIVSVLMAWTSPILLIPARLPRARLIAPLALSVLATILVLVVTAQAGLPRMPAGSTASFAARILVASMLVLFALQFTLTEIRRYTTLESRLVGSLVPIIAVPILFTTAIAAYNAFTSSQQQFESTLEAVASLKAGQAEELVDEAVTDLRSIASGSTGAPSIMQVLQRAGTDDEQTRLFNSLASTQIRDFITQHPSVDYEEVLILDTKGEAILTTYVLNQGASFADQGFFQQGISGPTARFMRYPGRQNAAGEYKLVAAVPFYGTTTAEPIGVVVGVIRPAQVLQILQPTMGLENVSTYVVDNDLSVVSSSPLPAGTAQAEIFRRAVQTRSGSGTATYRNYAGVTVLGYYDWNPVLQEIVVTEVPQAAVFSRSWAAIVASGLVGLLTILIAAIAVLATSRSISEPVSALARAAENLSSGQLKTRSVLLREDELGQLAASFNSMADQLQGTISELERRVADRTRELESQTSRLRTAAEVARDASLAPTLEDLLRRAATLVQERVGADYAAIYLLDERRQYAVLQAAPSEVGTQMLADGYRVLIGDKGPVGQASATGESQLVQKSREGSTDVGDSYHPDTQSQLAIPLRTREGTIGILDLQSVSAAGFTPADTAIMQLLADQLAAAIERSRLLLRSQERLGQLEQTYQRFTEHSWGTYARTADKPIGYRYDNVRLDPLKSIPEDARTALESGRVHVSDDGGKGTQQTVYVPIRLRDQTLGVISAEFHGEQLAPQTLNLLEQASERLGTALDNVRLLEESLRRASKERMIGEMTAKISSSISVRNVLQTAVEELGRAIPGSDVSIRFRQGEPGNGKDLSK